MSFRALFVFDHGSERRGGLAQKLVRPHTFPLHESLDRESSHLQQVQRGGLRELEQLGVIELIHPQKWGSRRPPSARTQPAPKATVGRLEAGPAGDSAQSRSHRRHAQKINKVRRTLE